MFSLFEGAQKKFGNLLDYVAAPEANTPEQPDQGNSETRPAEEVSINTSAIAGKVFNYAKTSMTTVQEKSNKLKNLVSQSAVFDNLNKQQEQFKESLNAEKEEDISLPWEGLPSEESVKQRFLDLSKNSNVFLEDAPVEVEQIKTEFGPLAKKLLELDENLRTRRYELVPKKLSEEKFWHNYLYRVSLLAKLIKEEPASEPIDQPQTSFQSPEEEQKKEGTPSDKVTQDKHESEKSSPSDIDADDWETELLATVDHDQIKEAADKTETEEWEDEIDELLASCETTDK
ncbi:BSD domain-containing protein [Aphelenchoides bicaudatus]|nr:BSD domain-containing protein [Aphelenchoides bicaudatus]